MATESTEFGTGKTLIVLTVVIGCFAVLWPKLFYPALQEAHPSTKKHEGKPICVPCAIKFEEEKKLQFHYELCNLIVRDDKRYRHKPRPASLMFKMCRETVLQACHLDLDDKIVQNLQKSMEENATSSTLTLNLTVCLQTEFQIDGHHIAMALHKKNASATKHIHQERPPHLRPDMMHPALREKGQNIPPRMRTIERDAKPGPMPGMRPTIGGPGHVVQSNKQASTMSIVMPIYTLVIVIFFIYTITKVLFKKQQDSTPKVMDFHMDPEQRKFVFSEEYSDADPYSMKSYLRKQERDQKRQEAEKENAKIVIDAIEGIVKEIDEYKAQKAEEDKKKPRELSSRIGEHVEGETAETVAEEDTVALSRDQTQQVDTSTHTDETQEDKEALGEAKEDEVAQVIEAGVSEEFPTEDREVKVPVCEETKEIEATPIEAPVCEQTEETNETIAEVPVSEEAKEAAEALVEEPVCEQAEESRETIAEAKEAAEASVEEPVCEEVKEEVEASVVEPVCEEAKGVGETPIEEPVCEGIKGVGETPVEEPVCEEVKEVGETPVVELVCEELKEVSKTPLEEPVYEEVREVGETSVEEPVCEKVKEMADSTVEEPVCEESKENGEAATEEVSSEETKDDHITGASSTQQPEDASESAAIDASQSESVTETMKDAEDTKVEDTLPVTDGKIKIQTVIDAHPATEHIPEERVDETTPTPGGEEYEEVEVIVRPQLREMENLDDGSILSYILDGSVASDMQLLVSEAQCEALSLEECHLSDPASDYADISDPVVISGKMTISFIEGTTLSSLSELPDLSLDASQSRGLAMTAIDDDSSMYTELPLDDPTSKESSTPEEEVLADIARQIEELENAMKEVQEAAGILKEEEEGKDSEAEAKSATEDEEEEVSEYKSVRIEEVSTAEDYASAAHQVTDLKHKAFDSPTEQAGDKSTSPSEHSSFEMVGNGGSTSSYEHVSRNGSPIVEEKEEEEKEEVKTEL